MAVELRRNILLQQENNKSRKKRQDNGAQSSQGAGGGSWWSAGVALVSFTASDAVATADAQEGGVGAHRSGVGATAVIWADFGDCASLLPVAYLNSCKDHYKQHQRTTLLQLQEITCAVHQFCAGQLQFFLQA